jgi:serine/threonine protein kinase
MSPAPERSQRISEIFHRAQEREPSDRASFLDEACGGDKALRSGVESLLAEAVTRTLQTGRPDSGTKTNWSPGADSFPGIASDRFRVIRRIGEGGMGVVYEAWDEERDVRSALKTMTGFDPGRIYLFKNEFRSLADVSHPNLVALYELFSEQGQWFFSMEYVEGVHFLEYVRPGGKAAPGIEDESPRPDDATSLPVRSLGWASATSHAAASGRAVGVYDWDRLRSGLRQLTQAVVALHDAGILHRDLKPANVKVTPEGRVVVLDFGLAAHRARTRFGDATVVQGLFGTVPYMAPELARGEAIAEPADWYAVGVMLFEAMTGRRPFEGKDSRVLEDKQKFEAPAAANFAANIPHDLDAICAGLLVSDPARRITGRQVLELLGGDATGPTAGHSPTSHQLAGEGVFVGREAQLAILQDAFNVTSRGAPCVAFVHGKSGIGKSTLTGRFLEGLAGRGDVVILAGRCYEQESMPYKALDSAVDSLARHLGRLPRHEAAELTPRDAAALAQIFPVLRRVEAIADAPQRFGPALEQHELRRRAFGALRELMARLGDRRRVVLYLDDLHWGDIDSARLLAEILRPPEAPALLLIGAYRTGSNLFLEEFLRDGVVRQDLDIRDVPVAPLNQDEAGKLAAALLARAPGASGDSEAVEQVARESGGNPYFVQELIAASGSAAGNHAPEASLDDALWSRVTELPADARRVLEIIAVAGQPIDEKLACEAAGTSRDPRLFGILRSARMIRGSLSGDRAQVEAWHDRLRETVVARLKSSERRRHHLHLGEALEAAGGVDAERLAGHFEAAGEAARGGRYYAEAAGAASSTLAFKHAAELVHKALDLLQPQGEEKLQLTVRLADALANAGHGVDAARQYQWAAIAASGPRAMDLERRAAYWFSVSGHVDEGREALENLLHRVGMKAPSPGLLLPAIIWQELRLLLRGMKFQDRTEEQIPKHEIDRVDGLLDAVQACAILDIPMAVYTTSRHMRLALKTGERTRIARAIAMSVAGASVLPAIGRSRAATLVTHLKNLARGEPTPYISGALPFTRAFVDFCIEGNWERSLEEFREAGRIFGEKCFNVAWETSQLRVLSLWDLLYLGRYSELTQVAAAYGRDGEERGDLCQATWIGGLIQPFIEMSAGRPNQALNLMDESLSRWTRQKYSIQVAASTYVRAWILLYQGDGAAAWTSFRTEWPALRRNLYLHVNAVWQWLVYARAQSALAAPPEVLEASEALRIAEGDARRLERDRTGYSRPLAQLVRAGCAARRGDTVSAARLLEAAAGGFDLYGMSMMAAAARYRLGEISGSENGSRMTQEAESAMRAEGVADPVRMTLAFVNGFAAHASTKSNLA